MGKTHGGSVTFNCEICGREKTIGSHQYNKHKHHFCSKECKYNYEKNTYNCPDGYSKCNKCDEIKPIEDFMIQKRKNGTYSYLTCKVCDYFRRHKNLKVVDGWSKEEYIIILDNVLNNKVEYIDGLIDKLYNKTILDIAILLRGHLKIGGRTKIRFKDYCIYCGKDIEVKLHQVFDDGLHFCSRRCNTKYYGEIKSNNTPLYKRICQLETCREEFYVNTTRVNKGKDKFCSPECSQKSQMVKFKGENNPNWQGGVSELYDYLRRSLLQWKNDSIVNCEYKCILTDERFDDIHHLYSFEKIIQETLLEINLELKENINSYTQEELVLLSEKCLEIHYKYPLGVCLRRDMHKLFHSLYGYGDNTPQQFNEFKQRYYLGEFNNILNINMNKAV